MSTLNELMASEPDAFDLARWVHATRDDEDLLELRFDVASGLYWFCNAFYDGQNDPLYRMLSTLGYRPGCGETGPETDEGIRVFNHLRRQAFQASIRALDPRYLED